ncbi:MepB family protein [Staphylococcus simiae]|uniref:MepB family protein n=1 Tax=Staphylococcus simiae TaxID=308354 RepID=UPI001F60C6A2|nr:MepB family protein [Staphylococcus simiae]
MYHSIRLLQQFLETGKDLDITKERYNHDYEAAIFNYNNNSYRSRMAKKTPTKEGYFVTCWTKDDNNRNRPFSMNETTDYLAVVVEDHDLTGVFIFPRQSLIDRSISTTEKRQGKMAFRVYPKWCHNLNNTALKTQQWQSAYFYQI